MRFLATFLIFFGPAAFGATQRVWDCQISAKLIGAGKRFLEDGLDSWNGDGALYCESGAANLYRNIAVSFNSLYAGFGADRNSTVHLIVNLSTTMNPKELQIRTLVNNRAPAPRVEWTYLSGLTEADVFITAATPRQALISLQHGTLFIRSSGD